MGFLRRIRASFKSKEQEFAERYFTDAPQWHPEFDEVAHVAPEAILARDDVQTMNRDSRLEIPDESGLWVVVTLRNALRLSFVRIEMKKREWLECPNRSCGIELYDFPPTRPCHQCGHDPRDYDWEKYLDYQMKVRRRVVIFKQAFPIEFRPTWQRSYDQTDSA